MKKFSILQIVVFAACAVGIGFALLIFSGKISIGQKSDQKLAGSLVMWGILPSASMKPMIAVALNPYPDLKIEYVQKDPQTFQAELVEALASGKGPDLVTVTASDIVRNKERLAAISYESLPLATFQATFIDQASLFATKDGIVALPLFVNPLVMYYNRTLLTSAFSVKVPETWDDVAALNGQVTRKNDAGGLDVSTIALGTFENITHAKELLAMLAIQAGGSLVAQDASGAYVSTFLNQTSLGNPVAIALRFYAAFANPSDTDRYSWNASLPSDRDQFVAGKLALYLGSASELSAIRRMNPNLDFQVAMMPQSARIPTKATFGTMLGVGVVKMSSKSSLAFAAASQLAQAPSIQAYLALDSAYAPVRRDLLSESFPSDPIKTIVYRSAIISRGFPDPDASRTSAIFKGIVDQVNAGLVAPEVAAINGGSLMSTLLKDIQK